jgi:hypothetical protein
MGSKINDQYWLDLGFEFIDDSLKRIKEEIDSLKKYVETIKIPYTLAALAESIFLNFQNNWIINLVILIIPIVIIELSKWYLNIALIGNLVIFDYRSPPQIENSYKESFKIRCKKLQLAKIISLVATIAMFIALIGNATYSGFIKYKQEKSKTYFSYNLSNETKTVLLSGKFPENSIISLNAYITTLKDSTYSKIQEFKIGSEGLFFYSFPTENNIKQIEFIVKYPNEKKEMKYAFLEKINLSK